MKLMLILLLLFFIKINAVSYVPNTNNSFKIENDETGSVFRLNNASLQQIEITGKVVDENNQPLPGASVVLKGTVNGVTTNFDGEYAIAVPEGSTTLVVTYVGYLAQEILISNQTEINIKMSTDTTSLEEVVVVGYGTQRKKDLVGAISSVKSEELVLSSTPSIGQALQGRVSGLQITQNSAQPGGGLDIQIRGAGSINASNQPLIVVDGFPITDFQQPGSGNIYDGGTQNILNSFNPNDIASIEVL